MTEETCTVLTELLKSEGPARAHIGREEAERLITFSDINLLQNSSSGSVLQNQIRVVREGAVVPPKSYIQEGKIDHGAIEDFLRQGFTVDFRCIESRWPRVKAFCDQLQAALISSCDFTLSRDLSVNMYLTPPGSKGLKPHYDRENVLVIQVGGEKRWSVYPSPVAYPMRKSGVRQPPPESRLISDVLKTGDVLYLPGGFVHEAETGPSSSLHLTISLWKLTWVDLFETLMKRSPRFREPLRTKSLRSESESGAIAQFLGGALPDLQSPENQAAALDELIGVTTSYYSRIENTGLGEYLESAAGFDGRASYRLCVPAAELYRTGSEIILCVPGQSVWLDLRFQGTLRELLKLSCFSLADLPPHIDKLAAGFVIKLLWNRGLLKTLKP